VAEDVEKVNADLVVRDAEGEVYTVRYEAVNAMLLDEFLKEHRKVQEQEATIAQLKSTLAKKETIDAHQQEQIEALTAGFAEGERASRDEPPCAASRGQSAVKPRVPGRGIRGAGRRDGLSAHQGASLRQSSVSFSV
jgi:uncharacterized coiled-coil protein SlyX